MGKNVIEFKRLLDEKNIIMEEGGNDSISFFAIENNLQGGSRVRLVMVFDNNDEFMNIYTYNYINVANVTRKDYIYRMFNDINLKYSYAKFTMNDENDIGASYHYPICDNFNAQLALDLLIDLNRALQEEYGNFMKIIWG